MKVLDRRHHWGVVRTLSAARGAWWANLALRQTRRSLSRDGLAATVRCPPAPSGWRERGVLCVLGRQPATCLERALVLQAWLAARGHPTDVVIGVSGTSDDFRAHAWVEGLEDADGYVEIHRVRPSMAVN